MILNIILNKTATDYLLSAKGELSAAAYLNKLIIELAHKHEASCKTQNNKQSQIH